MPENIIYDTRSGLYWPISMRRKERGRERKEKIVTKSSEKREAKTKEILFFFFNYLPDFFLFHKVLVLPWKFIVNTENFSVNVIHLYTMDIPNLLIRRDGTAGRSRPKWRTGK